MKCREQWRRGGHPAMSGMTEADAPTSRGIIGQLFAWHHRQASFSECLNPLQPAFGLGKLANIALGRAIAFPWPGQVEGEMARRKTV